MPRIFARSGLAAINIIVFFIEEAWIIAAVAFLPFWLAIMLVTGLLSLFAIISSCLSNLSDLPIFLERWIDAQKEKASERMKKVIRGAVWTSALSTAIIISPTTSAVMLNLAGIKGAKAFTADVVFSFISGTIWCFIYGGGIFVIKRIFE